MKTKITLLTVSLVVLFSMLVGFGINELPNKGAPKPDNISENKSMKSVEPKLYNPYDCNLNESFESLNFPPNGWLKLSPTNGSGWTRLLAGTYPVPGFFGGPVTTPPAGGNAIAFCNYNTGSGGSINSDQWLITPKLVNIQPNDSLTFWLKKFGTYLDSLSVNISVTTPTIPAMTINIFVQGYDIDDTNWTQYKFKIGNYVPPNSNIYIGFREFVSNRFTYGAAFFLDLVKSTAIVTEVNNNAQLPSEYRLSQNYPNPFNPTTNIDYSVAGKGFVSLKVYDMLGKEVATLVNENKDAGNYTVSFNASKLSSGVYYYKILSGDFSDIKTMILVK